MSNLIVLKTRLIHDAEHALLCRDQEGRLLALLRADMYGRDMLQLVYTDDDLQHHGYALYYYNDWVPVSSPEPVPLRFKAGPIYVQDDPDDTVAAENCIELHAEAEVVFDVEYDLKITKVGKN